MTETSTNPMRDAIQSAISDNPVILFMKGTPEAPGCGFSARTVAALQAPCDAVMIYLADQVLLETADYCELIEAYAAPLPKAYLGAFARFAPR